MEECKGRREFDDLGVEKAGKISKKQKQTPLADRLENPDAGQKRDHCSHGYGLVDEVFLAMGSSDAGTVGRQGRSNGGGAMHHRFPFLTTAKVMRSQRPNLQ